MNGRVHHEDTPEGRIAAVAKSLCIQMDKKLKREPDYADFRDVLRPFIKKEILNARIEEARMLSGRVLTARVKELAAELEALEFSNVYDL
jgi:hypothetical protein